MRASLAESTRRFQERAPPLSHRYKSCFERTQNKESVTLATRLACNRTHQRQPLQPCPIASVHVFLLLMELQIAKNLRQRRWIEIPVRSKTQCRNRIGPIRRTRTNL